MPLPLAHFTIIIELGVEHLQISHLQNEKEQLLLFPQLSCYLSPIWPKSSRKQKLELSALLLINDGKYNTDEIPAFHLTIKLRALYIVCAFP